MNLWIVLLICSTLNAQHDEGTRESNLSPRHGTSDERQLQENDEIDTQTIPEQIPTDQKNEPLTDEPASDNDAILPPDIDLPTFNEHTEQQRNQAAEPLADQDISGSKHSETMADRRGKAKKNYAADSCGAKINKHAPELLNAHYLLKKNKDQYARTDTCQSLFDFTVELCEIIQLDQIQIGANEVFSSYPLEFRISAADADKQEWIDVGTFTASKFSPKAPPQTFLIDEQYTNKFVKFVRFEQLSYQGEEQICTLTSFGVFGFGQYNPDIGDNPDDKEPDNTEGDPLKGIVKRVVGAIGGIFVPNSDKNDTIASDPSSNSNPVIIEDSYHDCWFHSAIFCYCDCTCIEFVGSPLFDVYVGPYNNEPLPPVDPLKLNLNDTNLDQIHDKNETKTEAHQQHKKDDPAQLAMKNQIKEFQANLSRVGDYLETLSISYKKQMNDMRTSFNRTAARLTKAENAVRDINENILEILSMIKFLYSEVNRIDTTLERTIVAASIMIGFQIIMVLLWCRPRRDRQMQGQLAKIEIQLDALRESTEKVLKNHQQLLSASGLRGRRYTYDGNHHSRSTGNLKAQRRRNSRTSGQLLLQNSSSMIELEEPPNEVFPVNESNDVKHNEHLSE